MSLRTDKISGLITGSFGGTMMAFALLGLCIVMMQRTMLTTIPPIPVRADGFDFAAKMSAMHGLWFVYMPLMFAGGLVFAVSGWLIYRGSKAARRVAQFNCVLGYAWGVAYGISCAQLVDQEALLPLTEVSESTVTMLRGISSVVAILITSVFPTALLFILSRPRGTTIDAIVCE